MSSVALGWSADQVYPGPEPAISHASWKGVLRPESDCRPVGYRIRAASGSALKSPAMIVGRAVRCRASRSLKASTWRSRCASASNRNDVVGAMNNTSRQPGPVLRLDDATVAVMPFDVTGDRIKNIWGMRNPEKLRPWTTGRRP